jgi:FMN phosphatase YigB (HAD superfamily)
MKPDTIIWDFDGTILPSDPYDSEQTLLMHRLHRTQDRLPFLKRIVARSALHADRKEWLGGSFKKYYLWVLKGTGCDAIKSVARVLAVKKKRKYSNRGYHFISSIPEIKETISENSR